MRLVVIGAKGQLAQSLLERTRATGSTIVTLARPQFDLLDVTGMTRAFDSVEGDIVINAAAYTAVNQAESEEELATRVNAIGAGALARVAAERGLPIIHLSTDYVFDGTSDRPYREDDAVGPKNAYGRSKLSGEIAVAAGNRRHVILRTAWVYSPFGENFLKTMLRLGETRDQVSVVADQRGSPTSALDIADAAIKIAEAFLGRANDPALPGIYHMTGSGEGTWADFAEQIFSEAPKYGRRHVAVRRISTSEYPTPAYRPPNSVLSNEKLQRMFGISLPDWRDSTSACVERLLGSSARTNKI